MDPHRFQCRCGTLQGEVAHPAQGVRAVCYCRDCQAYAHVLGQPEQVLDAWGGTEVVATQARHVRFTSGTGPLACLSLSPRGLLRWYADCCHTPIANTPRDWKLPYVGLVHTCLRRPQPLEASFPGQPLRVNTASAHGTPPPGRSIGASARFGALALRLASARLTGRYRSTSFFDAQGGPVSGVRVVPKPEVEAARAAAGR